MMDDRKRKQFDPRSPVQPGRSSAPYFLVAIIAAVMILAAQRYSVLHPGSPAVRSRQFPATAPSKSRMPASSARDIRTVFSADDYPASARASGEEGTVQAKLSVDASGRVMDCWILHSSGHRSLDGATCNILRQRARFAPARNGEGKAVPSVVVTPPVRWQLEG
ncbi:MAG TPA: energy transducer TonB [Sphingomicrobium sp.]|jgi:protein TonB|nr:energy transducer TonB [Sphingomicrobium sp.]